MLKIYGSLFLSAFLLALGFVNLPNAQLRVNVLDIGQGDAILIRTPSNQKILIDAGPNSAILAPLGRELNFFDRRLDLVILTHPDADHVAGFSEIFRRYEVRRVLLAGVLHESAVYADVLEQIAKQRIPILIANSARDFDFGNGVTLDVLAPSENLTGIDPSDTNATSIVARLAYGKTSILLTGDAETTSEKAILRTPANLESDLLKLGHHGAKTSSGVEFLRAVAPKIALISAGKNNQFGHPAPETLAKLSDTQIYSTIESGTLEFISDGKEWEFKKP